MWEEVIREFEPMMKEEARAGGSDGEDLGRKEEGKN